MKALYQKIRTLNGKNYGLYKSLADKPWDFGDFALEFLHVQGDPYAPASRVMIRAKLSMLGYATEWGGTFERRLALSDFLYRKLGQLVKEKYPDKDAAVIFDVAGPEMLVRNSLWIDNGELRACLQVKLPGDGRKIQAELAAEILTMVLPDLVSAGIYYSKADEPALQEHYRVVAERKEILEQLESRGLSAFVPDGAVLPRASGLSELPLAGAVPFAAPEELAVTLNVCGREIRGMGIPKGITVITGGAFHGKSTLLQALTRAVYPHVPGDGREGIVIDETALRIGVEDGRSVRGTDLSMFVRDLPGGVSTKNFNTLSASGSTSEAANLLEAMEAGARTFLIDEDSSAVNFLIRDIRVRKLLGDDREPLIPLTDRIKEISAAGNSFILVAGACGDYLDIADNIIVMANYKAECPKVTEPNAKVTELAEVTATTNATSKVTEPAEVTNAPKITEPLSSLDGDAEVTNIPKVTELAEVTNISKVTEPNAKVTELAEVTNAPLRRPFANYMQPLQKAVRPASAVERQVKVKLAGDTLLQIGFLVADTSRLNTLVDKQQRFGAGFMLLNLLQNAASNSDTPASEAPSKDSDTRDSIAGVAQKLCESIKNVGFRNLPQGMSREMSLPRAVDIACVAFRLHESR